jgi:hypothetical protein
MSQLKKLNKPYRVERTKAKIDAQMAKEKAKKGMAARSVPATLGMVKQPWRR